MPEKLSEVGRRYAALAAGAEVAADPALTPADAILGDAEDDALAGRYEPPDAGPPTLSPSPTPCRNPQTKLRSTR